MTTVLAVALAVEALLVAVAVALLVVDIFLGRARARRREDVRTARGHLLRAVHDEAFSVDATTALRSLPAGDALALAGDVADAVSGEAHDRLVRVATEAGLPELTRRWCASRSWARRLRGIRAMTRLGLPRDHAVRALLDDPVGPVAAAAADSVDQDSDPALFDRLLAMLADHRPECRYAAKAALAAGGPRAAGALADYLGSPGAPCMSEALEAASALTDRRLLRPALECAADTRADVREGAAGVLGGLGGAQAAARIEAMLTDQVPQVRQAAVRALGRLGEWDRATAVARLLDDPEWPVRRAAALVLGGLGPTGRLYLRRAAAGSTPAAREAALFALGLPQGAVETISP